MKYGLPPPGRVKPRRDRKMAKKQVHTMATAENVAPGSDWHIPLRTADAEVWLQENGRVHTCVKRCMRRVEAAGTESCKRRQLAIFRVRGALDKRR
jgi:hypothetical protein